MRGEGIVFNPANNVGARHHAGLPCEFPSILHQNQGWDTPDSKTDSQLWIRFRVDFGQPNSGFELNRGLFELGSHSAAWGTPRSPEVDEHGKRTAHHMTLEACGIQFDRVPGKQGLVTATAIRSLIQTKQRNPIDRTAVRACNEQWVIHDAPPLHCQS